MSGSLKVARSFPCGVPVSILWLIHQMRLQSLRLKLLVSKPEDRKIERTALTVYPANAVFFAPIIEPKSLTAGLKNPIVIGKRRGLEERCNFPMKAI